MRATALPRALETMLSLGAAALMALLSLGLLSLGAAAPARAVDLKVAYVTPAELTPQLAAARLAPLPLRPGFGAAPPALTNDLLAAYVARQQELQRFDGFDVAPAELTETVLLSYIERSRDPNRALDAIESMTQPALNADMLEVYAQKQFVPTARKVKLGADEQRCLAQAIYHEARGESEAGQWAVANVVINRAMSRKFPHTLCGVVFQNADQGRYRCQFTFACDGRSDAGTETGAWNRAVKMARAAYREFQRGERPGVIPNSALYYHTTAVSPSWSSKFQRVAAIGAHVFYAAN